MNPPPDNIVLLTDGLPTQGDRAPRGARPSPARTVSVSSSAPSTRCPAAVPVNVILYPMEGDPLASAAFWKVAMATRGSMMTPSSDWP